MMNLWDKFRRFLLFWLVVFVILILLSMIIYHDQIFTALSNSFSGLVSSLTSIAISVFVLLLLFRILL
ncbi:MAG: hypothetical protein IJQ81_07010 [Oscillibacter sp.]|nr:hypothetical protein [Oscillibacter sp.]